MKKVLVASLCFCLAPLGASSSEHLDYWPHWRGPNADGVALNGNPPLEWSEENNIKWKVEIPGEGASTPIVWGDKLFVVTAVDTEQPGSTQTAEAEAQEEEDAPAPRARGPRGGGDGPAPGGGRSFGRGGGGGPSTIHKLEILCYDRNTGELIWQQTANEVVPHESLHQTNTHASSSPVTDGEYLYVTFGSHGIYCYDLDGELQWERDLGQMSTRLGFGEGASMAVHGDSLIVAWDHEGPSFIANLNARTGETKWKVDRDEISSWDTPLVIESDGVVQVVVNGTNRTRSYDIETGELLWECGGQTANAIPSVVTNGEYLFATSGFRGMALYAIPLSARGDITDTDQIAWTFNKDTPYVPSPLLYGDSLYFLKSNSGIISSVNARTGEPIIDAQRLEDLPGTVYSSPVGAADRIYLTSRIGVTLVIKHGDEVETLAVNHLDDVFNASPVVVGNQLFLRGSNFLYCIEETS